MTVEGTHPVLPDACHADRYSLPWTYYLGKLQSLRLHPPLSHTEGYTHFQRPLENTWTQPPRFTDKETGLRRPDYHSPKAPLLVSETRILFFQNAKPSLAQLHSVLQRGSTPLYSEVLKTILAMSIE